MTISKETFRRYGERSSGSLQLAQKQQPTETLPERTAVALSVLGVQEPGRRGSRPAHLQSQDFGMWGVSLKVRQKGAVLVPRRSSFCRINWASACSNRSHRL